MIMNELNV